MCKHTWPIAHSHSDSEMSEGLAERKAARGGYMSTEHLVIAWSAEIGRANFQIGAIFININKPQI